MSGRETETRMYDPGTKVTQKNVGCVLARTRIGTRDAWLQAPNRACVSFVPG